MSHLTFIFIQKFDGSRLSLLSSRFWRYLYDVKYDNRLHSPEMTKSWRELVD